MDYSAQKDKTVPLSSNGNTRQYFVENIVYIESKKKEVIIYLNVGEPEIIFNTLREVEDKLKEYDFYQINRNTVVNLRYFKMYENTQKRCFSIKSGKYMTVSRRKWCEFKKKVEK